MVVFKHLTKIEIIFKLGPNLRNCRRDHLMLHRLRDQSQHTVQLSQLKVAHVRKCS